MEEKTLLSTPEAEKAREKRKNKDKSPELKKLSEVVSQKHFHSKSPSRTSGIILYIPYTSYTSYTSYTYTLHIHYIYITYTYTLHIHYILVNVLIVYESLLIALKDFHALILPTVGTV